MCYFELHVLSFTSLAVSLLLHVCSYLRQSQFARILKALHLSLESGSFVTSMSPGVVVSTNSLSGVNLGHVGFDGIVE
jgi:hypothetical protein